MFTRNVTFTAAFSQLNTKFSKAKVPRELLVVLIVSKTMELNGLEHVYNRETLPLSFNFRFFLKSCSL